jgi:hypothetical protein
MNMKLSVFILLILFIGIASCKKEVDDAPVTAATVNLNVVNATADTLNFYVNGSRVNVNSFLYPFGYSGYTGVAVGAYNFQFKKARKPAILFELPAFLDSAVTYSAFVGGLSAEQSFSIIDTLKADTASRAMVRFVNASPDSGNLDVYVGLGDTVNFKARAFKSATVFVPVTPGNKSVRLQQSGSGALLATVTRTFVAGRIYTIFSKGTVAGLGDNALGTGMVVNR